MFSSRGFSSFSHILQLVLIKMLMKCSSRGWRTQNLLQSACRQNLLGDEWWRLSMPRHLASKSTNTYRRICHASSHLVGASIGRGAVATCEASRRRHLHFVGGIHGHGAHAAARREVLFELQRFGRAFEWRWRINFAAFLFHLSGKSFYQVISMLQVFFCRGISSTSNSLSSVVTFNFYQNSIFTSTSFHKLHFFRGPIVTSAVIRLFAHWSLEEI